MSVLLLFWQKNIGDFYYEPLPWFMTQIKVHLQILEILVDIKSLIQSIP